MMECMVYVKKRWQEYTEELYKKDLHDQDNHDGMITHLEPDILECEVKLALESITTNKASGGDRIPVELFQILKDDVVKVLHSICQQIWKTQQWPQDWKRSVFIPIPNWVFFGRNDAKAETPVLWPPHAKSRLIEKDPDAGKDWGQEEKGMTEDEMAGWHHRLNGHEFDWTPGVGDGQGGLACCDSWGHRVDTTERWNWLTDWWCMCYEQGLCKRECAYFAFTELKKMHVQPDTKREGNSSSLEEGEMILLRGPWIAAIKPQAPHIAQNKHNNMLCGSPAPFKGFLWPVLDGTVHCTDVSTGRTFSGTILMIFCRVVT